MVVTPRTTTRSSKRRLHRVVSLLPSATEIICAVGATDHLAGISHECDHPSSILDLPRLTKPRVDTTGSSRAIDAAVRAAIIDALSIYAVDESQLAALAPDVIVTQDLCEVCAVAIDDVRRVVSQLANREHVTIVSLRPTRFADVMSDIERVAAALDCGAQGKIARWELEHRVRVIAARAAKVVARPRVVTVEWLDPIMIGGLWMPELIQLAGGAVSGATAGEPAPTITPEQLEALKPEVVLIKPCGFALARTLAEREIVDRVIVPAVKSARVYLTDGNAYFNRSGPRLVESLEILAACVQPDQFEDFAEKHRDVIVRTQ